MLNKKPVLQVNKKGVIVHRFKSLMEAEKVTGIDSSCISSCASKLKHYLTAGGYKWEYLT